MVKISDVWALCRIYGADEKTTDALAGLAAGTNDKGWWHGYGDIMPADFELYLGPEAAAKSNNTYDPERIHGLFQTADYAREIEQATSSREEVATTLPHAGRSLSAYDLIRSWSNR